MSRRLRSWVVLCSCGCLLAGCSGGSGSSDRATSPDVPDSGAGDLIAADEGRPGVDAPVSVDVPPADEGPADVPTDGVAPTDLAADVPPDIAGDPGEDAIVDPGTDAASDPGVDPGVDAGHDAGLDPGVDAGADPGADGGADAGLDTGVDAGTDTGGPAAFCLCFDDSGCADGATCTQLSGEPGVCCVLGGLLPCDGNDACASATDCAAESFLDGWRCTGTGGNPGACYLDANLDNVKNEGEVQFPSVSCLVDTDCQIGRECVKKPGDPGRCCAAGVTCTGPATCTGTDACASPGGNCQPMPCEPQCGDRVCGDDGCSGSCGACTGGEVCQDGTCECVPQDHKACCGDAVCWFDSCGNAGVKVEDCPDGCLAGVCKTCVANCTGRVCGTDGCGGSCGDCLPTQHCTGAGQCLGNWTCDPSYYNAGDGCDCGCGTWDPDCDNPALPVYGCKAGQECGSDGVCQDVCAPSCNGLDCGDDGCGGSCGTCDDQDPCTNDTCSTGLCVFTDNGTCPKVTTYDADVKPVFVQYCASCHTTGGSGGSNFAASYAESQKASYSCAGKKVGACALVRIQSGSMPAGAGCTGNPSTDAGKSACLTQAAQSTIQAWIADGMPEK